ncbi:MAG: glycosyltransferase [Gammaproteobacteria bacterium]
MQTFSLPTLLASMGAAAALSFTLCWALVKSFSRHARYTADAVGMGTQNRHGTAVPRVGGAAVGIAALGGTLCLPEPAATLGRSFLLCAAPALACGLAEDTTRRVAALYRLAATAASAVLAWYLLGAQLVPVGLVGLDLLLVAGASGLVLTVLAVAGIANAANIIDGSNGLASGCLTIMLLAVALAAWKAGDLPLAAVAGVLACSLAGFMIVNYPSGQIFLGDGGAYFGGIAVAVLALVLVQRNPVVSPLFVFALTAYPVTETLYSAWRRMARRGRSPFVADRLHLHSLIQNRLLRCADVPDRPGRNLERNARTAPYLWLVCLCGVVPCTLAFTSSAALGAGVALTVCAYGLLYRTVVRGRAPAWLRQEDTIARTTEGAPSVLS